MNYKNRLFASAALGVVCGSIAHAQGYSSTSAIASITVTGVYSASTGYATSGVNIFQSGYYTFLEGPYSAGSAAAYDFGGLDFTGASAYAFGGGSSYASPTPGGYAFSAMYFDTQV